MNNLTQLLRRAMLAALVVVALATMATAQSPCVNGLAAGLYPCDNIDLYATMGVNQVGGGDMNDIWGWTDPLDGKEYVILGRTNGTAFIDISNPTSPVYLGNLNTNTVSSLWRDIKVYGNYAFIVSEAGGHGMQVFDLTKLRNVNNPPVNFSADAVYTGFGNAHNIVINEATARAYGVGTNTASGGLHIVDISNPLNPTILGTFSQDGYTHDAQVVTYIGPDAQYQGKEIAFACNENTITIVDVDDPTDATLISTEGYSGSAYTHQGWLTEDHKYFVVGDELDEQQSGVNTRTYFFNVEDLNNPFLAGTYTATTSAIDHNLYIKDGIAYQSNYRAGLRLLDVSNAPNAEEVGFFDLYPSSDAASFNGTWSNYPYFASGVVAASHIEEGLFLLMPDLPEPCTESCGCTDATACNYDASASNDDGSCDFSCYGCTNSEACNYDATATIDNGSCFLPDPGFGCECSSDGAINTTLSGTQLSEPFTFEGTGNPVAGVFDLTLNFAGSGGAWPGDMAVTVTDPNGQCVSFGGYNSTPAGCTSLGGYQQIWPSDWTNSIDGTYTASLDLSSAGLTSAGTWSVALYNGWSTGPSVTYDASFTLNDVCAVQNGTPGCTLLEACNYDSEATVDDGSCILPYSEVYIDEDGDGIGGNMAIADACDPLPANWVLETGDCDDSNSSIYPGAPGVGLGVDNNCDGVVSGDEVNACPQDLNNDGSVTVADVLLILGEFGCTIGCAADVDGDGAVSVGDVLNVLSVFGQSC
tara:strand:+ start:989 stop:3256 length:2268 start_codon:yes stop_codon:yes gene_type:complete